MEKYESRRVRSLIRAILMQEWDPIGVAGIVEAADEYDSYVGDVFLMVFEQRASVERMADHLYDLATGHMGLSPGQLLVEGCLACAKALVALRESYVAPEVPY